MVFLFDTRQQVFGYFSLEAAILLSFFEKNLTKSLPLKNYSKATACRLLEVTFINS